MLKIVLILTVCNVIFASKVSLRWSTKGYTYSNSFCNKGEVHVTYKHDGKFDPDCYKGAEMVRLTDEQKALFVDYTNEARDLTAAGENGGLPKAARMGAVTWNSELEFLAKMSAKLCTNDHDQCRNTENLRYVGQNIYSFSTTEDDVEIELVMKNAVDKWRNEVEKVRDFSMKSAVAGYGTGHLNQLVYENCRAIGCAIRKEPDRRFWKYVVYCNYDYGLITKKPIYKTSKVPGIDCETGWDDKYPNLCANEEPIPEDWMFLFPEDGSMGDPKERYNY